MHKKQRLQKIEKKKKTNRKAPREKENDIEAPLYGNIYGIIIFSL